ncbi:MAG: L,D-transpeptidase [Solirubrobacterales bacterium]
MTTSLLRISLVALCALALLAGPAAAAETTPLPPIGERTIGNNASANGVDLGGMTVGEAEALIERRRSRKVRRATNIVVGARRHRMTGTRAKIRLDSLRTAKRAYYATRNRDRRADNSHKPVEVDLAISYSKKAVSNFAALVARRTYRAPRNASVRVLITRIRTRGSRRGTRISASALAKRIRARMERPSLSRTIRQRVSRTRPAVTRRGLASRYPVVLTVDRRSFRVRVFKRLRFRRSYGIALGMAGYTTPAGTYRIRNKQINPAWHAPNKSWAGSLAGKTIPGGAPNNPLKARWMGIVNGVGIHGTGEPWSIGTRASHGCIRMRVSDVKALYRQVPVGTLIRISR